MPNDEDPSEPGEAPEPASDDDADVGGGWPLLSDLDFGVCLATRPRLEADGGPARGAVSPLSGGRRRPRRLVHWLWLSAVGIAGFIAAAAVLVRI